MAVRVTAENLGKAIKRYKGDPAFAPGRQCHEERTMLW